MAPTAWPGDTIYHSVAQDHEIDHVLDRRLIADTTDAIERAEHVRLDLSIRNSDRSTGAMLSGAIAMVTRDCVTRPFTSNSRAPRRQSFGAFLARVTLELEGEANDYVGKGLTGGQIVVYPPR